MAINPVPVTIQPRGTGSLDTISSGLDIIGKTLGIALEIPKYLQQNKATELEKQKTQAEISHLKAQTGALAKNDPVSEFNDKLIGLYKDNYKVVPQATKNSIEIPIGEHKLFFEPKQGPEGDENFKKTIEIKNSYTKQSEYFMDVANKYAQVLKFSQDPSGVGDLGLVRSLGRMIDPHVRQVGDPLESIDQSESIDSALKTKMHRLITGKALGSEASQIRNEFFNTATDVYNAQKEQQGLIRNSSIQLAKAYKVNPDLAVPDLTLNITQSQNITKARKGVRDLSHLSDDEIKKRLGIK